MALDVNKRDRTSIVVSFDKKQTRRTAETRCASYLRNFITLYFGTVLCLTKNTGGNSCYLASSFCPSRYCHHTSNNFCPSTSSLICFDISARDCAIFHPVHLLVRLLPHLELVFTDDGAGAEKYCIRFLSKGPRSLSNCQNALVLRIECPVCVIDRAATRTDYWWLGSPVSAMTTVKIRLSSSMSSNGSTGAVGLPLFLILGEQRNKTLLSASSLSLRAVDPQPWRFNFALDRQEFHGLPPPY